VTSEVPKMVLIRGIVLSHSSPRHLVAVVGIPNFEGLAGQGY